MSDISKTFRPNYLGAGSDIFKLAFVTGLLTVLTLGIYRFWAKTRIRRFVWSSIKVDGDPAEYTGTGLEKLLGFLVAVVVLAVYLGIVQLLLSFVGFNLFGSLADPNPTPEQIIAQVAATYITLFAVLPLVFFAQYRGRRYMLSRTRWRGLRFGMTPGALGYMLRACLYFLGPILIFAGLFALLGFAMTPGDTMQVILMAIVTIAGIIAPVVVFAYATFHLQKYMVDRQWFGDAQFVQNGKWTALIRYMKHFLFAVLVLVGAGVIGGVFETFGLAILLGLIGYFWLFYAGIYFSVMSYRYLTENQVLDGQITFQTTTSVGEITKLYVLGGILVGLIAFVSFLPVGLLAGDLAMSIAMGGSFVSVIVLVALYLLAFAIISAASLALISQPVLAHYVTTTYIENAEHLTEIQQRTADSIPDADGFADALDVGGAF